VAVTAENIAGESSMISGFVIVGDTPDAPINLTIVSVTPTTSIVINFLPGEFTGGIPLRGFILNINGVDNAMNIGPSL
jgi:hypothetical protein